MNKILSIAILSFWTVLLICIFLFVILSLLSIFVTIRNLKLLNDLYNSNNLSWFTEDGRYKSLRQRIQIGKERTKITKEFVNSENHDINNKSLFQFLMNQKNMFRILRIAIIVLFIFIIALHVFAYSMSI